MQSFCENLVQTHTRQAARARAALQCSNRHPRRLEQLMLDTSSCIWFWCVAVHPRSTPRVVG